jgi:hypothetical protein
MPPTATTTATQTKATAGHRVLVAGHVVAGTVASPAPGHRSKPFRSSSIATRHVHHLLHLEIQNLCLPPSPSTASAPASPATKRTRIKPEWSKPTHPAPPEQWQRTALLPYITIGHTTRTVKRNRTVSLATAGHRPLTLRSSSIKPRHTLTSLQVHVIPAKKSACLASAMPTSAPSQQSAQRHPSDNPRSPPRRRGGIVVGPTAVPQASARPIASL